jgi:beta-fructofuranosidase
MLVTARKDVGGGNWKGVLAKYTSTNLLNWNYQGVFYDGGNDNFFNMECADLFKLGSTYYLLFSDQGSQRVVYRKSTSLNGPWSPPSGTSRLDGTGFYAAKHLTDKYGDTYLMGWVNRQDGSSDSGNRMYGGNLVVHKLYQQSNGDLAVTIPHTLKANLEAKPLALHVNAQAGTITTGAANTFTLASAAGSFLNSVVFDPIMATHFKVSTTVNYASAGKDFGFMLGACDNYNGFYSLRFIPSQNRFSLDKTDRRNVTASSTAVDVPFQLSPNTDYKVDIVEENSVVVVYLNNTAALTCRVYRAPQSSWGLFADNATATFKNVTVTTSN